MANICAWCGRDYSSSGYRDSWSPYCSQKCQEQANGKVSGGNYRGGETYERAVKERIESLEKSGVRNSEEILKGICSMSSEITGTIRKSTMQIVASNEQLEATYKEGINKLDKALSNIEGSIEHGFAKVGWQLDQLYTINVETCKKLDKLHDVLNNPLLTASRELYRRAVLNFEKGYYEEAIEDCKAALEKNKTDTLTWFLLGQVYLFGAGKYSNVINLLDAESAFTNSAKYIDADIGKNEDIDRLASKIYYHIGFTKLMLSNNLLIDERESDSKIKLIEAEKASRESYQLWEENLLAAYEQAKELHFLGKDNESLELLTEIFRRNKDFALKASCDKDFEQIWDKIDERILLVREEFLKKFGTWTEEVHAEFISIYKENPKSANYSEEFFTQIEQTFEQFKKNCDDLKLSEKNFYTICDTYENREKLAKNYSRKVSDICYSALNDLNKREDKIREAEKERAKAEKKEKGKKLLAELVKLWENQEKIDGGDIQFFASESGECYFTYEKQKFFRVAKMKSDIFTLSTDFLELASHKLQAKDGRKEVGILARRYNKPYAYCANHELQYYDFRRMVIHLILECFIQKKDLEQYPNFLERNLLKYSDGSWDSYLPNL